MKPWILMWGAGLFVVGALGIAWGDTTTSSPSTIQPQVVTGSTQVATYVSAKINVADGSAGDLFCLQGSATKVVKIKKMRITGTATAAVIGDARVITRSTADTGGTSTTLTPAKMDQLNPTATAVPTFYSVPPTAGTQVGVIRARKMAMSTVGNTSTSSDGLFHFAGYWDQPLTLRGTSEFACINVSAFGGGTMWNIEVEHTEE